jgi:hypothetical protein
VLLNPGSTRNLTEAHPALAAVVSTHPQIEIPEKETSRLNADPKHRFFPPVPGFPVPPAAVKLITVPSACSEMVTFLPACFWTEATSSWSAFQKARRDRKVWP